MQVLIRYGSLSILRFSTLDHLVRTWWMTDVSGNYDSVNSEKWLEGAYTGQVNFKGSRDTVHAPSLGNFATGHIRTIPENMHIKFEASTCNDIGAVCI